MKNKLVLITKLLLDLFFYSGIFVTATLYFIIKFYGEYNIYFKKNMISLSVIFTIAGIFAVLIIYELRKMFRSVIADDCFIRGNVLSLRKMGNYSFLIAFVTSFLMIYVSLAAIVVMLVFLIAGLFSKVLSQVFDKAVTYKLENDFTI